MPVKALGAGASQQSVWFTLGLICMGVACLFGNQNILSPNLTSIAEEFGLGSEERDRLLGARLSLAFSVFSIPGAMSLGLLADCVNRKKLFVWIVAAGAIAMLMCAYVDSYDTIFYLRVLSGTATNAVIPIAFSFLGDLYPPENRSLPSTLVTAAMGLGILLGQVTAGLLGPRAGWRSPFVVIAFPGLASSLLTYAYITEPVRGGAEIALADLLRSGVQYKRKLDWGAFVAMMKIPTNIILISQCLPGTIPWGMLFAYLNDFLSQEKGLPVEQATLLVSLFGIGSAVGGIGGGLVGQMAYKRSKPLLPLIMGVSTILGTLPMLVLLNASYNTTGSVLVIIVCTFLAGILANINGTNVRPLLLNVNLPETRGSAVSVANLVANLGKGIGPTIASSLMGRFGGRQGAFNVVMCMWFVSGFMVLLCVVTLLRDEAALQASLSEAAASMSIQQDSRKLRPSGHKQSTDEDKDAETGLASSGPAGLHYRHWHGGERAPADSTYDAASALLTPRQPGTSVGASTTSTTTLLQ